MLVSHRYELGSSGTITSSESLDQSVLINKSEFFLSYNQLTDWKHRVIYKFLIAAHSRKHLASLCLSFLPHEIGITVFLAELQ